MICKQTIVRLYGKRVFTAAFFLLGCTKMAEPNDRSIDPAAVKKPATQAENQKLKEKFKITNQKFKGELGVTPLSFHHSSLVVAKNNFQSFSTYTFKENSMTGQTIGLNSIDGVVESAIQFKAPVLNGDMQELVWGVFNEQNASSMDYSQILLRNADGNVTFLEEGRRWFQNTDRSSVKVLAAYANVLILLENNNLMIIQPQSPTFTLTKNEISFVDRIYSADSDRIIFLGKDRKLHIIDLALTSSPVSLLQKDFELTNIDSIDCVGFLAESKKLVTFSKAGNKILDLETKDYEIIPTYEGVCLAGKAKTISFGASQILVISPESDQFELVTISEGEP